MRQTASTAAERSKMCGFAGLVVVCLSVALPQYASAGDLTLGMSEREVLGVMGPPDAVRLERNAVVCLTYALRERGVLSRAFGQSAHVVALKENRLVDYDTVRPEAIRLYCSRVAGRWDPSMPRFSTCDWRAPGCVP